jgi:RecA/RadA recombinase
MEKDLAFLKKMKASLEKAGIEEGSDEPPRYWYSTGNHVMNKTLSGSYLNGIPQGRVTGLVGPSGAGKSFVLCNLMREAQKQGAMLVVLDSENALDKDFVRKIGVDTDDGYMYYNVTTIPEVEKIVSNFLKGYREEFGKDEDAPPVFFAIDSLNMLMTETEEENFDKGVSKGDQGQLNKQLKAMLKRFVQKVGGYNITMVVTGHVYANQNVLNGEGVWMVADAIKFSLSQIALLTKLKLREGTGTERHVTGIQLKVEGYKTRFTRPFQTVTIEVPYETGMDPYNGLLDVAIEVGVVVRNGSMYIFNGEGYKGKNNFPKELLPDVLVKCEAAREKFLEAALDGVEEVIEKEPTMKSKRKAKHDEE